MTAIQFGLLVSHHTKGLESHAFRLTNNIDDSQDLLQETVLKALRYQMHYDKKASLRAWLYVIMKNIFINGYRKRSKSWTQLISEDSTSHLNPLFGSVRNSSESYFAICDINQAIGKLPAIYSITLIKYLDGLKYEEIAEELLVPIGTVKTRIHHARALLKKSLQDYHNN